MTNIKNLRLNKVKPKLDRQRIFELEEKNRFNDQVIGALLEVALLPEKKFEAGTVIYRCEKKIVYADPTGFYQSPIEITETPINPESDGC
jgi:hypothetical protein